MGLPATPYLQAVKVSLHLLPEFWDPSITRDVQARNFKLGMNIMGTNDKNSQVGQ